MKKKVIAFLATTLLIINVLPIVLTAEDEFYFNERLESVIFSEPEIKDDDQYITLNIQESSSILLDPGKPILPVYTKIFEFPFGTKIKSVNCKPSQIGQKSIKKEIRPSPKPVPLGLNTNDVIDDIFKDETVYNSDEFFPYSWFDYRISCGLEGTHHLVFLTLRFYPVRYSPSQNTIKYAKNVDIKIEFYEPIHPAVFNDEYDMVIIAPSQFLEDLEPLKNYKDESGRETILVSLDDIFDGTYFPVEGRDDQEKIKYFIKNAIEEWNIKYVLLAGGANKIPVRMSHVPDEVEESLISDLYYADIYQDSGVFCSWDYNENDIFGEYDDDAVIENIDRVDLNPDVRLGRLNFRSLSEVSGVVNKIITYETTGAYMEEWFSNMILCAGDTHPPPIDDSGVPEGEYLSQKALNIMDGFEDDKIWATNNKVKWSTNIDNAIENGSGFIHMTGHGTPDCWTTHPYLDGETWWPIGTYLNLYVANLKNSEELPIIIIGGCSNLQFSETPCFGWTWVKNPDGGAIASYGNSALGWGYIGTMVSEGLGGAMQLCGFKAYGVENAKTTGELWVRALKMYLNDFGVSNAHSCKVLEEWTSFSDPSLRIAKVTEKPNKPDKPEGPSSGELKTYYTYKTRTTDSDDDLIKYCFDWGDESVTWTGWQHSGENISISHRWEKPGYYEIKVKARDEYGLDSEWSESTLIHIGGLDVSIKGGISKVTIKLENIDDEDATDIDWSISVKGGLLGFIKASSNGTIESLLIGETTKISCGEILGFGRVNITLIANSASLGELRTSTKGFVLGFIVIA